MWAKSNEKPIKKKPGRCIDVRVTTMDAELEFSLDQNAFGRDLFDLVCRTIGLREMWYFGLHFVTVKGYYDWLDLNKKVLNQNVKKNENGFHFYFLAKYFPEDASEEIIQDITQHLFFLQVKQSILNMDIYCQPEASVLLASYAVQAKFGDFDEVVYTPGFLSGEELLPQRVVNQYQMTTEMWEDRIKTWWMNNKGMSREEAEIEYLRIAQDLKMYGVHYFPITNKKDSELWFGVRSEGVCMYEKSNKLEPKTTFNWNEIRNIYFKDKKFTIKTTEKIPGSETVTFISSNLAVNKVILELCIGNHNLFLRRRQSDSLEVQQMKAQAKEDRIRKQNERAKFEKEQTLRVQLEREKAKMQQDIIQLHEQIVACQEALRRSEETADLLAEKARISEEEALVLAKRTSEAESEIQRIRISALRSEEEKVAMERKTRDAEHFAARMVEESEKRSQEAEKLKEDLMKAKQAEKQAKQKLYDVMRGNSYSAPYVPYNGFDSQAPLPYSPYHMYNTNDNYRFSNGPMATSYIPDGVGDRDIRSMYSELEKERVEYLQKSKHIQEQLSELRTEIEGLKIEDRQTQMDKIYSDSLQQGEDKYSTLKRKAKSSERDNTGAGSVKSRVGVFDGL